MRTAEDETKPMDSQLHRTQTGVGTNEGLLDCMYLTALLQDSDR